MSSILKALRRLEEDRARKNQVAPEIAANLLRSRLTRRRWPRWFWPTLMTGIALLVAALFSWILRPAPGRDEQVTPSFTAAPAPAPSGYSATGSKGGVVIEEVMDQRRPLLLPHADPPRPLLTPPPAPAAAIPTAPVTVATEPVSPSVIAQPLLPAVEERQSPVVSAIAWQEESSARMAVIEGLPMMTGEVIGTAKVQEIQPDRILFVEDGVLFSVRLHQE